MAGSFPDRFRSVHPNIIDGKLTRVKTGGGGGRGTETKEKRKKNETDIVFLSESGYNLLRF
jgi:hypothetical protein